MAMTPLPAAREPECELADLTLELRRHPDLSPPEPDPAAAL